MRRGLILFLALVALSSGCSRSARALSGTGSTFIGPLLDKWSQQLSSSQNFRVSYDPIGSGVGFDRWKAGAFDFCCTDAPLSDKDLSDVKGSRGDVLHIPLTIGAVVPIYHLDGVEDLVLNGEVMSEIYLGTIRKWNDPKLEELNGKGKLPDQDIIVMHRQDVSGTTWIWTSYLHTVDKEKWTAASKGSWPENVTIKDVAGKEEKVQVKRQGAYSNAGLAADVKKTPFSIGYVSLQEAKAKVLTVARITPSHDRAQAVTADAATVAAAVNVVAIPEDLRFYSIGANPVAGAWPIWGTTWAIVSVEPAGNRGETLRNFLTWATHDEGQKIANLNGYVRLPDDLVKKIEKKIDQIKGGK